MRRALWALAIVTPIIAAAIWVVWFSPWLALQEVRVQVSGTAPASAGEFPLDEALVAVGVPTQTPLVRVDTSAVADRVAALPQVAAVSVTRVWPATLLVEVDRRVPVAAEETPTGTVILVDVAGVPVREIDAPPDDLPLVSATPDGRAAALAVAAALPTWLQDRTEQIEATTRNDVTLVLDDGAVVRWGSAADSDLKVTVLEALLPVGSAFYDVSAPGVPTTADRVPGSAATPSPSPTP